MEVRTRIREYVYCVKCGSDITWNANDPNDDEYGGVLDKLEHHQEGLKCIREQKLKEILK
jgi:hypothetical protein